MQTFYEKKKNVCCYRPGITDVYVCRTSFLLIIQAMKYEKSLGIQFFVNCCVILNSARYLNQRYSENKITET